MNLKTLIKSVIESYDFDEDEKERILAVLLEAYS